MQSEKKPGDRLDSEGGQPVIAVLQDRRLKRVQVVGPSEQDERQRGGRGPGRA
jgi:hypothetical protein